MHGFTWRPRNGAAAVDDPLGAGISAVNGIGDHGNLADLYTDESVVRPERPVVETVLLQAMPQGTVTFGLNGAGQLIATVNVFGLTPGSSHAVRILKPDGAAFASFGTLTADGGGQSDATLSGAVTSRIPDGSHLVIGLNDPIARTPAITARRLMYQVRAAEDGPQGWVTFAYYPAAKTITVTLSASGLTPGAHAANINLGSCRCQGPVQHILMDFVANGAGQITQQVRTVTGVTSPIPASSWYFYLHQGNSNNIWANGQPTVNFRPLLCADI